MDLGLRNNFWEIKINIYPYLINLDIDKNTFAISIIRNYFLQEICGFPLPPIVTIGLLIPCTYTGCADILVHNFLSTGFIIKSKDYYYIFPWTNNLLLPQGDPNDDIYLRSQISQKIQIGI